MFQLAGYYLRGADGLEPDLDKAFTLIKESAAHGLPIAQHALGSIIQINLKAVSMSWELAV
jgi:TPR repeat protein